MIGARKFTSSFSALVKQAVLSLAGFSLIETQKTGLFNSLLDGYVIFEKMHARNTDREQSKTVSIMNKSNVERCRP